MFIWKIAVFRPIRQLLDYLPPKNNLSTPLPGVRVKAPMGNSSVIGVLIEVNKQNEKPKFKLRAISEVLDDTPLLNQNLLNLNLWAAQYYHHPIGDVFANSLPSLLRKANLAKASVTYSYELTTKGKAIDLKSLKKAPQQLKVVELLLEINSIGNDELKINDIKAASIKALVEKKYILKKEYIKHDEKITNKKSEKHLLNQEQEKAYQQISKDLNNFNVFLIDGVTGSGKTEVYMQVIDRVLSLGKKAMVLVPEIGLTPQTLQRFYERFQLPMAVLHSGLTDRQRLDAWLKAKAGIAKIIIGTRSCIFTQLDDLGVIIIDEEHDQSFKQQTGFRYNARDLAIKRAQLENIPIILGSATPALESLHNVNKKLFQSIQLSQRVGQATLPKVHIVDIRNQKLEQGFSKVVIDAIKHHLNKNAQILIFLNRRGFAPTVMCYQCSYAIQCHRCDAYLTLHRNPSKLVCHHCGYMQAPIKHCPKCQSTQIYPVGLGTEKIEQSLQSIFNQASIIRIDRDSTRKKGEFEKMLNAIHAKDYQILVGTQMLAKGHHFPQVSLAVIMDVDSGFLSSDLRAEEHIGQLITQVAGRAGREKIAGEVFIQTRHPENELLNTLIQKDYKSFANELLIQRNLSKLPPFSYLALMRAEAFTEKKVFEFLNKVKRLVDKKDENVFLLGPIPAPMTKKAGKFRGQLLIQSESRKALHQLLNVLTLQIDHLKLATSTRWSLDIDPQDLF